MTIKSLNRGTLSHHIRDMATSLSNTAASLTELADKMDGDANPVDIALTTIKLIGDMQEHIDLHLLLRRAYAIRKGYQ